MTPPRAPEPGDVDLAKAIEMCERAIVKKSCGGNYSVDLGANERMYDFFRTHGLTLLRRLVAAEARVAELERLGREMRFQQKANVKVGHNDNRVWTQRAEAAFDAALDAATQGRETGERE